MTGSLLGSFAMSISVLCAIVSAFFLGLRIGKRMGVRAGMEIPLATGRALDDLTAQMGVFREVEPDASLRRRAMEYLR